MERITKRHLKCQSFDNCGSAEVAFLLLTQLPRVRFSTLPKNCSVEFYDVAGIY